MWWVMKASSASPTSISAQVTISPAETCSMSAASNHKAPRPNNAMAIT